MVGVRVGLLASVVLACTASTATAIAPYWGQLGTSPSLLDGGAASYVDVDVSGTTPHVTYIANQRVIVRRWDGTDWVQVGTSLELDATVASTNSRLAIGTDANPVVAWRQGDGTGMYDIHVKRWNGSAWVSLGSALNIDQGYDTSGALDITVDSSNRPVVAWNEAGSGNGAKVMYAKRWNSGTSSWDLLGGGPMNLAQNRSTNAVSLTTIGTTVHATWTEEQNGSSLMDVFATSTTGATWTPHNGGSTLLVDGSKAGTVPSISTDGTNLYVAWNETTAVASVKAVHVKRWNGSTWSSLGGAVTADGMNAVAPTIDARSGTPYLTWTETYASAGMRVFVAAWTGSWTLVGPTGLDADWLRNDTIPAIAHDGTNPVVAWLEYGNKATVVRWGEDVQSGTGTLVPSADRSNGGFTRRGVVSGACNAITTMYTALDEDVDSLTSGGCFAWWGWGGSSADYIDAVDPSNLTAEFDLSDARPVLFAHRLRVRFAGTKIGDRSATATVEIRRSDGTVVGTPTALSLSGTDTSAHYDITGIRFSKADLDGLYARLVVNVTGAGTATTVRMTAINVDVSYVIQDCGAPPCPPVRPENLLPVGGTTQERPTLEADMFADTDIGDTHTASQWQLRTAAGSYAAPVEDTGITTTDLMTHQVASPLSPNTAYWWRVRFRDSTGAWSSWSDETRFAYDTTPPRPPEGRRPATRSTTSVTLTWDIAEDGLATPEEITYDVEAAPDGVTWGPLCDDVPGLDRECTLTPNTASTPVYFRVRARDPAGNASGWAYYADATYATRRFSETTASTYMGGAKQANSAAAVAFANTKTPSLVGVTGFHQYLPNGTSVAAASMPAGISPNTAGRGWFLDELAGTPTTGWCVNDGELKVTATTTASKSNGVVRSRGRLFRTTASGGVATGTPTLLGAPNGSNTTSSTSATTSTFTYPSFATPTAFAPNESLYFELWLEVLTTVTSSGGSQVVEMNSGSFSLPDPGACAATPTATSGSGSSYAPPTLSATYQHNSTTPGHVVFEIYDDAAGVPGNLVHVGYSPFELAPGTATTYVPQGLPPSSTYHWRATSEDRQGRRSGTTAAASFTIIGGASGANSTPAIPTLVAPAAAATVGTTPVLTAGFSDPDGDTGYLEYQVCLDATCVDALDPVRGGTAWGVSSGTDGSWTVASPLTPATTYHWRARASDGLLASPWSSTRSFTATNVVNAAPNVPTLVLPVDGAGMATLAPALSATFSDPDAADTGTIQFQVCSAATCADAGDPQRSGSSSAGTANGADGAWTVTPALTAGTWYWRARALDGAGATSAWSGTRRMVVGGATISITVDSSTVNLGLVTPGVDVMGSTVVTVTTDSVTGYDLLATDEHDTWAADCVPCGPATIPDWTGTGAAPTTWSSGTAGSFGVTVRDAPGGRLAKWGPGTGTAENDTVANAYAGLDAGTTTRLHQRSTFDPAAQSTTVTYRLNASTSQVAGTYGATVVYSATANP